MGYVSFREGKYIEFFVSERVIIMRLTKTTAASSGDQQMGVS